MEKDYEKIKTFEDACAYLNCQPRLGKELKADEIAFIKLKIIAKALREGKKIEINGRRKVFYKWWTIWSKNEISKMTLDEKCRILYIKNHPIPIGIGAIVGSSRPL